MLTAARTFIEIGTAFGTQSLTVLITQQLAVHIQDNSGRQDLIKICFITIELKSPCIIMVFILRLRDEHSLKRNRKVPFNRLRAAVAIAMQTCREFACHDQNTCCVSHLPNSVDRLGQRGVPAKLHLAQIKICFKVDYTAGAANDLRQS